MEEFDISAKIIITFTAYDRGHEMKDEEAFSAFELSTLQRALCDLY